MLKYQQFRAWAIQRSTIYINLHHRNMQKPFTVSNATVVFHCILIIGLITAALYMYTRSADSFERVASTASNMVAVSSNLDLMQDELDQSVRSFDLLSNELLNIESILLTDQERGNHDHFSIQDSTPANIRKISDELLFSASYLAEYSQRRSNVSRFLATFPTGWPVISGLGYTTFEFGPNIHPVNNEWYMHKGYDIAGIEGTPIIASASGTIIESSYNESYGNFIVIEHNYGFSTRYPHLRERYGKIGDTVQKADVIGTMGSTGIATGTHLHFELMLGNEVLDPVPFLMIENDISRWVKHTS